MTTEQALLAAKDAEIARLTGRVDHLAAVLDHAETLTEPDTLARMSELRGFIITENGRECAIVDGNYDGENHCYGCRLRKAEAEIARLRVVETAVSALVKLLDALRAALKGPTDAER